MTSSTLVRAGQFNQAARQGAYILIALALPRLGLSRADIGEWESLLFIGYVLGFSWTSGLLQGFLVLMGELPADRSGGFAHRAITVFALLSAAVLLTAAVLHPQLFRLLQLDGPPLGWYFFFVLLLSRWPSYCFEQTLLLTGRVRLLVGYAVVNALGLMLSLLLPLYLGYGMLEGMRTLALFAGAKLVGIGLWSWLTATPSPADVRATWLPDLREWMKVSAPLMAYATVAALVVAVDPWVVNYWSGGDEAVFAVFRYGVRELPFLAALINGMTVVTIPLIARERGGGLDLLRRQSRKLFHYVFGLTLLMLLTADWWWTAVFTDTFADSLPVFRTYLLVVGCRLVFAMTVLTALRETKQLYLWAVLELVVNIVLSLVLAPRFGLLGIIWATVIASYFHEICLIIYLRYRTKTAWRSYADLRWYGVYLVVLFGAYYLLL
ncbi:O-antigen/teichoic acid export membrane protein [Neolewinella xylanilytica]|uniref:O-antigen/teichoic acid export membrane protein n=1 Tax=Neolewinella xylanilytica TaxID=1514080 RepID=A0A2S6I8K2_9BACT|nr:polysaccharide biosynthesis C-terminal domain-containing protein [Neolewinella xylanilytica]PPK87821.1 O-antigen/teichoic acid export membrane protein [Neolewinella xylanilytica]